MSISLDLNGGSSGVNSTTSYTEQASAGALFASATIASPGTGRTVHSISLQIAGVQSTESLSLSSVPSGLTYTWNQATGVLTLSSAGADPSDAIWQTALRNVVYSNTSDTPPVSRAITVTASDDQGSTGAATDTVNITAVNDAPVIDLNGALSGSSAILSYVENGPLAVIAPSAGVTDVELVGLQRWLAPCVVHPEWHQLRSTGDRHGRCRIPFRQHCSCERHVGRQCQVAPMAPISSLVSIAARPRRASLS